MAKRNMYKGPMDKTKRGQDRGWEVGVGGAGEWWGKMETTVLEQQFKTKEIKTQ